MLDARPRVRQEHEKAASRHCLPRRPPGSASRIISGEGAKGPPASPRGSLVRSLSTKQTRMVSIVASGLVHSGDASLNGFRWLVKSAGPHSHFGKPSPATPRAGEPIVPPRGPPRFVVPAPDREKSSATISWRLSRSKIPTSTQDLAIFCAILSAITLYRGIDAGGQSRSHRPYPPTSSSLSALHHSHQWNLPAGQHLIGPRIDDSKRGLGAHEASTPNKRCRQKAFETSQPVFCLQADASPKLRLEGGHPSRPACVLRRQPRRASLLAMPRSPIFPSIAHINHSRLCLPLLTSQSGTGHLGVDGFVVAPREAQTAQRTVFLLRTSRT